MRATEQEKRKLGYQARWCGRWRLNDSFSTVKKIGGFRRRYFHHCYCLDIIPKNSAHKPLFPELWKECCRLNNIDCRARLICREKLDMAVNVKDFNGKKQAEIKECGW